MNFPPCTRRPAVVLSILLAFAFLHAARQCSRGQGATAGKPEADAAWKEVEKATRPPTPPAEWQGKPTAEQIAEFRAKQSVLAGEAADKVKDFYTRFPDHRKAAEARTKEFEMLQFAVYLGNT